MKILPRLSSVFLLCLSCLVALPAAAQEISFYCQADGEGAPRLRYYIRGGELRFDNGPKRPTLGPATVSDSYISALRNEPLMTDGTGKAIIRWRLDRATGRYTQHMFFHNPAKPKPLEMNITGACDGYPTGSDQDTPEQEGKALDQNGSSQGSRREEERQRQEQEQADYDREEQSQRDQEQADRVREQEREEADRKRQEEQDRLERERRQAETDRIRKQEEAEAARVKAEQERKAKEEADRIAKEKAEEERKRQAERDLDNKESGLRTSFNGWATTCPGGGKDVLYLQTSRPSATGCNVRFEARCPGSAGGQTVSFGQSNYIGGSCMGVGDIIRIGHMSCAAEQVQISMTQASCR